LRSNREDLPMKGEVPLIGASHDLPTIERWITQFGQRKKEEG